MKIYGLILIAIMWLAIMVSITITVIRDVKEIKSDESRRQLLDDVEKFLRENVAVNGMFQTSHEWFMKMFCDRFRDDR